MKSKLTDLPEKILEEATRIGIELDEDVRSGTFFHVDQNTIFSQVNDIFEDQIEMMDTKQALKKYPWLEDYRWKLVDPNKDEYTKRVHDSWSGGYFMRVMPGAKVTFPLQSCLLITESLQEQRVHNIIIAEKDSDSQILTTCAQHGGGSMASHLGISEIYVKENAKLNFAMVHHWGENTIVRPRSATMIEKGGEFISNYICMTPTRDVQMYPKAFCNGENAKAVFNSILYVQPHSKMDLGSWAVLNGRGSTSELITRAIIREGSELISRGTIEGNNTQCRGHLECRGLLLDEDATLQAIPILEARKRGAELTHEAAVGKLSDQEISYLMSRGLDEDAAVGTLIRGFMDVGIMGLSPTISQEMEKIIDMVADAS